MTLPDKGDLVRDLREREAREGIVGLTVDLRPVAVETTVTVEWMDGFGGEMFTLSQLRKIADHHWVIDKHPDTQDFVIYVGELRFGYVWSWDHEDHTAFVFCADDILTAQQAFLAAEEEFAQVPEDPDLEAQWVCKHPNMKAIPFDDMTWDHEWQQWVVTI
ncbi:hypothetical protein [Achromobacter phage Motura]|uniref:Uncharacterized protein n=1 Tax=Achromobacter phage Motura TaxID=2591403 RepID=A0A514CSW5_9CAUD|nr:hypothetical protein H1O15_gp232 [Achromobacter phage Motura]QDH83556.1 hypothetical protein [Achromobacter phage Motura]